MARLIYSMATSLDGFVSDAEGNFDWVTDEEELHAFVVDHFRSVGTYLYGRKMYDVMKFWETAHTLPDLPPPILAYADTWRAANKVVYSTSLTEPDTERTRIERVFDPEAVRRLKAELDHDLTVDGPTLAAQAIRAGLVDEYQVFIGPAIAGGGNPFFPADVRVHLELQDVRRFPNGLVFLSYRVRNPAT